jgi:hypothetical protein
MSGIDIRIIGDDKGVARLLRRVSTAVSPPAMAAMLTGVVAPYLSERAEARFANEGDDVVGRWAPLLPATQAARASGRANQQWTVGDAHPINQRTHELHDYITGGHDPAYPHSLGATLAFPQISPTSRRGIVEKMKTAQLGKHDTVPRPVLGLNEQDLGFVLTAIAFHIKGK